MIYKIVAVRDSAVGVYAQPMFVAAKGQAIRSFGDEIQRKDDNNMLYKHPKDFDLYELGTYDDVAGVFESVLPQKIASGVDFAQG